MKFGFRSSRWFSRSRTPSRSSSLWAPAPVHHHDVLIVAGRAGQFMPSPSTRPPVELNNSPGLTRRNVTPTLERQDTRRLPRSCATTGWWRWGSPNDPNRPSYRVAQYLQEHGFRIVPVNPGCQEILGERCYAGLRDIPFPWRSWTSSAKWMLSPRSWLKPSPWGPSGCGCSRVWKNPTWPAKPNRPASGWLWTAA